MEDMERHVMCYSLPDHGRWTVGFFAKGTKSTWSHIVDLEWSRLILFWLAICTSCEVWLEGSYSRFSWSRCCCDMCASSVRHHWSNKVSRILWSLWRRGPVFTEPTSSCKCSICSILPSAMFLLHFIQLQLLDFPHLTISLRSQFVNALVLLSRGSGLYPECLVLRGVQWAGDDPIAAGRFGDVYKGKIRGQHVAIKKLRIYEKTNISKHLKVRGSIGALDAMGFWSLYFQQFSREAIIWRNLWHPNVLPFHGIYHLNEKKLSVCLVSPWMEHGNIRQFLEEVPNADRGRLVRVSHSISHYRNEEG